MMELQPLAIHYFSLKSMTENSPLLQTVGLSDLYWVVPQLLPVEPLPVELDSRSLGLDRRSLGLDRRSQGLDRSTSLPHQSRW